VGHSDAFWRPLYAHYVARDSLHIPVATCPSVDVQALCKQASFARLESKKQFIRSLENSELDCFLIEMQQKSNLHQSQAITAKSKDIFNIMVQDCVDNEGRINFQKVFLHVFDFFDLGFSFSIEHAVASCINNERSNFQEVVLCVVELACFCYCIRVLKDLTPYNKALMATCLQHLIKPGETPNVSVRDKSSGAIPYSETGIAAWHSRFIRAIPNADPTTVLENCFRSALSSKVFQAFGRLRGLCKGISWSQLFTCKGFDPNVVIFSDPLLCPPIHLFLARAGLYSTEMALTYYRQFSSPLSVTVLDAQRLCQNRNLVMYGEPVDWNEFLEGLNALLQIPGIMLDVKGNMDETPLQLAQNNHFDLPLPPAICAGVIQMLTKAEQAKGN
jgi:hypothetical protein